MQQFGSLLEVLLQRDSENARSSMATHERAEVGDSMSVMVYLKISLFLKLEGKCRIKDRKKQSPI
jgi:hypothetical protein